MPARTRTTLAKPKLQLQLQAQQEPQSKKQKTSDLDFSALDKYLFQSSQSSRPASTDPAPAAQSGKRFQLKNLRRKLPQINLQSSSTPEPPAPRLTPIRQNYHGGYEISNIDAITDLQIKIVRLTEDLRSSQEALKKVEGERKLSRERNEALDRRARYLAKENRDLKARTAELDEKLRVKASATETKKQQDDLKSNLSYQKNEILLPSHEESAAFRALITHQMHLQSELAPIAEKDNGLCDCVAAKAINAILNEGSRRVSPTLQPEILVDEMQQSPAGLGENPDASVSSFKLYLPPNPQPEGLDNAKRRRKEDLKKRIQDARNFVEGLKRENDVLESILMSDGSRTPSNSSEYSGTGLGSRRKESMTRDSARRMIDE